MKTWKRLSERVCLIHNLVLVGGWIEEPKLADCLMLNNNRDKSRGEFGGRRLCRCMPPRIGDHTRKQSRRALIQGPKAAQTARRWLSQEICGIKQCLNQWKVGDELADLYLRAARAMCGSSMQVYRRPPITYRSSPKLRFRCVSRRPPIEEACSKTRQSMHELGRSRARWRSLKIWVPQGTRLILDEVIGGRREASQLN
ncbi:uncharacterized protein LY89DRAFT_349079 [Mollisia scopiformis]|uniref:Uncharacterized protein n=1 Tax=Mollisia scopiformis TaxID=149040 RepID=A0A132B852_MOLSC|nr:uncharacterized protein LY89DRAFT_349079 [Mollisia scopiformis]KUJ08054.1 hypothetical protein LY89DRAFT_349079 [Mollisia scopiformis]